MNATEADALAKRIINTWRGGPPLTEWRDALTPLNAEQAEQIFTQLRDELDTAPSIAKFLYTYRALQRTHLDQSWRRPEEPNPISFTQYLDRLRTEEPDRADELEQLTRRTP